MKSVLRTGWLFAVIGLVMLVVAVFLYIKKKEFTDNSVLTQGKVVGVEKRQSTDSDGHTSWSYYPVCEFYTEGNERITFTSGSGSNPARYDVGDEVEILYDPNDPYTAYINKFFALWGLPFILGLLGLVFFIVGIFLLTMRGRGKRKRAKMMAEGVKVTTLFAEVEKNTSVTVNGRHPYRILTHYTKNNELYVFKSDNIWFNPALHINVEEIDVWVDPMDMKKYYMDISFLPKKA